MRRFAWLCIVVGVLAASPAAAEPPAGFADFPWGTSRSDLIKPV